MATRRLGKFSVDDKVEVLSDEKGFSGAWALATIIGISRGRLLVEFSRFVDEAGVAIREKVPPHRLRHVPLYPARFNVHIGLRVEGYLHDCWWPGEVVEMHARKGTRIQFDDGANDSWPAAFGSVDRVPSTNARLPCSPMHFWRPSANGVLSYETRHSPYRATHSWTNASTSANSSRCSK